jgi:hypothetical protein
VWLLDVSWTCERLVASVADGYVVAQSAMQVFYYSFYSCHIVVVFDVSTIVFLLLFLAILWGVLGWYVAREKEGCSEY